MADFKLLEPFLKHANVTDAWVAGRHAFLGHSPRNTYAAYQDIYVRMADDYCFACGVREAPVDEDVLCAMLAWPAIEFKGVQSLPPQLQNAVVDFLPDIRALNPEGALKAVFRTRLLPAPVHDIILYLATTTQTPHESCVLPPLHARLMAAHGAGETLSLGQVWQRIDRRIEDENGGNPPKSGNSGPVFH